MQKKVIASKVARLLKTKGIALWKLGEVLGSKGGQQAKIDRANRFLRGEQKSISLDEIEKLAKFFEKPTSFFIQKTPLLKEEKASYGKLTPTRIDKLPKREVDEMIETISLKHPQIFRNTSLQHLSESAKRIILKAFYKKVE